MPIFYFHPLNATAVKLADYHNAKGFLYTNRGELEFKLQSLIVGAGLDLWPTCHCILGSLGGNIVSHLSQNPACALDPDNELDRHTLKLCKSSKTPWSSVKLVNGNIAGVIGYCSTPASNPYGRSPIDLAQKGILRTSHVPFPV